MKVTTLPGPDDVAAAGRLADVLTAIDLWSRHPRPVQRLCRIDGAPRIVYLVARAGVGDAERVLLGQAEHLARLGAEVTVLCRGRPGVERRGDPRCVEVPFGQEIVDAVPPCDLIVAGCWDFVLPARCLGIAPVVLFELGELHLLGDVPEQLAEVMAGSLRAADATFTIGVPAQRSLRERYRLASRQVPNAVDLERFHPAPGPAPARRTVLFVGWDGVGGHRIADARQVAAGLAASHPDVAAVWVTPYRPCRERFGEVVVGLSDEELARCYREAAVFVSTTGPEPFSLHPLEAMASGVPVVSTEHPGVTEYAVDGDNALLAPIGDVERLLAYVRLVLDDAALASSLSGRGLETAQAHAWPAVAHHLLDEYESVIERCPLATTAGRFRLRSGGLAFVRDGDGARFRARLASCPTRTVAVPVSEPAIEGHRVVRWRVVAERDAGAEGTTRAYLPARSNRPLGDVGHEEALGLLRDNRVQEALGLLVARCQDADAPEQAVLGRWVVLSLLKLGRADEAAELAAAFAWDFPTHPDYFYLGVVAARAARHPIDVAGPLECTRLLGAGARFDEWFENPYELLVARLGAGAAPPAARCCQAQRGSRR